MKEKLRKLDGKPTEPGDYRYCTEYKSFLVKVCAINDAVRGRELHAIFIDDGVVASVSNLTGQWSERIPDCDWEGEA